MSPSPGAGRRLLLGWLVCAVLVVAAAPLGERVADGAAALRFLVEFLTEGRRPWLSAARPAPRRQTLALGPDAGADRWEPGAGDAACRLVLVHGLTPDGKDDPRVRWAAGLLARSGCRVLVPDLPGLRAQRLRREDARVVAAALAREPAPLALVAVSVGLAPALAAAVEPAAAGRVGLVVALGGHADARELVRYFTTGAYGLGAIRGRVAVDPALARGFLALNLDVVADPADRAAVAAALTGEPLPAAAGAEARAVLAVLDNRDPARVDALLAALPPATRARLDAVSPLRDVGRLRAGLVLVHGRDDPAIPFTESLRLAAAADPRRTRVVLVKLVAHVEGQSPAWRRLRDLAALWSVAYELRRPPAPSA